MSGGVFHGMRSTCGSCKHGFARVSHDVDSAGGVRASIWNRGFASVLLVGL